MIRPLSQQTSDAFVFGDCQSSWGLLPSSRPAPAGAKRGLCGSGDGCLRRERYGHYSTLLNELKTEDEKAFFNYTRRPRGLYDEVLRRVEGRIEKKDTWYRKSLPPGLKLSITLRHLACSDNYPSLSYNFRVAPNTVSLIINEVCDAIKAEVIQCPTTTEEWTATAQQFEKRCHTAVVLWMASMWRSPVLGILALSTDTTKASSPVSS
ncbi:hypothetical protein KUCAC02_016884 [Chaenocephalus aceratus]|nr:hypothetical protein KUCAC02_016884 [Chaenocephalus aceratus]